MHIVLGANGHVGSALAQTLLKRDESVTVVLHDAKKSGEWEQKGAQVAVVDVHDAGALRGVLRRGARLFLLNPPAQPFSDTATEERQSLSSILEALNDSGLQKVVAESTYGAQPGERLGDLGVLYEMEQALSQQPIPTSIIRAAYYMSNWDMALQTAQRDGQIPTFYPVDFKLPMVAPHDIGELAARLMTEPVENTGMHSIEGPELYSPSDVATAFAEALQKPVVAVETPREQWKNALENMGFSDKAAQSFAAMTAATLEEKEPMAHSPIQGATSLRQYIAAMVSRQK